MRWCSSGMHDAPEKGGEWIKTKGARRWQCATCWANKKPPTKRNAFPRSTVEDMAEDAREEQR